MSLAWTYIWLTALGHTQNPYRAHDWPPKSSLFEQCEPSLLCSSMGHLLEPGSVGRRSNVSAGQWGAGEEGQLCSGTENLSERDFQLEALGAGSQNKTTTTTTTKKEMELLQSLFIGNNQKKAQHSGKSNQQHQFFQQRPQEDICFCWSDEVTGLYNGHSNFNTYLSGWKEEVEWHNYKCHTSSLGGGQMGQQNFGPWFAKNVH